MLQFYLLLSALAVVVVAGTAWACFRLKTAMHPLTFLAPMILYLHVVCPWVIMAHDGYREMFRDTGPLVVAAWFALFAIGLFCIGIMRGLSLLGKKKVDRPRVVMSSTARSRLLLMAFIYTVLGYSVFLAGLILAGGFTHAYGRAYGGAGVGIGYFNSAILLPFTAAGMFLLARQDRRLGLWGLALLLVMVLPQLVHAILGTRRGPMYRCLATMIFGHVLVTPRRIHFWTITAVILLTGGAMIVLVSQRRLIFLGADFKFDTKRAITQMFPFQATPGTEFAVNAGAIQMAREHQSYFWGKRLGAFALVRTIPRQIWPTKYEDVGLPWYTSPVTYSNLGFDRSTWKRTLGWFPSPGHPVTVFTDLFMEFSWFALLPCYAFGYFVGFLWRKAMRTGGFWSVVNFLSMLCYPYLNSQSLEAYWWRFLFMAGTFVPVWLFLVRPCLPRYKRVAIRTLAPRPT